MLQFHERLARIGLEALESHGFVLAGGYAISVNGIGNRPSADVDLFTNVYEPSLFEVSVARLRAAFLGAGLSVHDNLIGRTFADFSVTDDVTQETSSIQIGVNYREFTPARFEIGPVLDVRDAVAGKMSALWSRGEARDFDRHRRSRAVGAVLARRSACHRRQAGGAAVRPADAHRSVSISAGEEAC
jgi:hypothetical protein